MARTIVVDDRALISLAWITSTGRRPACSEPLTGWVAVSAMFYQESRRKPECDYRRWLPMDKLVAKIGYSIFVFRVE